MASKYFKIRQTRINAPSVSEAVTKQVEALSMNLIKSAESLLGRFDSVSVDDIPEDIDLSNGAERLEDVVIPQQYNAPDEQAISPRAESEGASIINDIDSIISKTRNEIVDAMQYYGKNNVGANNTFYPRIIKYINGEPYYDLKISGIDDIPTMSKVSIKLRKIS